MSPTDKPIVWLQGTVRTPPLSSAARVEIGYLLRRLQRGELLSLPHSRPMPTIGSRCHELRVSDVSGTWRLVYRIDGDALIVLDVFQKKTQETPVHVIRSCRNRLRQYDDRGSGGRT